ITLKSASRAALAGSVCALALTGCSGAPAGTAAAGKSAPHNVAAGPALGPPVRVRLMTEDQYFNTLTYVFGTDIKLAAHFAPLRRTEGLLQGGASSAGA